MHMTDALVSPAVGGTMLAISAAAITYASVKTSKDDLTKDAKIPLMGIMSAFVFAAQMINFTIPGTGSSGHIGGGILLAAVLGGYPAFLALTAVLLIQAFCFADGGLLALGCNIFNMAFIPCFLIYPLIFKPLLKKQTKGWIIGASLLACIIGLQLGSFAVVLETLLSNVTELPFKSFVLLMQPIHLAIGAIEGLITAGILSYINQVRPEIIAEPIHGTGFSMVSIKKVLISLAICTILIGGILSLFASSYPDGLEWSIFGVTQTEELASSGQIHENAANLQAATAFMPDYAFENSENPLDTTTAGIGGGIITLLLAGGTAFLLSRYKHHQKKKAA